MLAAYPRRPHSPDPRPAHGRSGSGSRRCGQPFCVVSEAGNASDSGKLRRLYIVYNISSPQREISLNAN